MTNMTEIAADICKHADWWEQQFAQVTGITFRRWADALDAAAKEQDRLNAHGMAYTDSIRKRSDDQAAEIERLRHHHCSNCGRRSEFISRCDPCLTKKLAGMERLIAEQATEIERLRAFLSRAVKDYQGDEWVPDAEAALAGGDA